jgi:signal transduction histidine kinase
LLLILRCFPDAAPEKLPELLREPEVLELALRHLDEPIFVEWKGVVADAVYRFAVTAAGFAARIASASGRAPAEAAWTCGLLAPLGWMAVCALDPSAADGCLSAGGPVTSATQRQWWGLDQAAIARRLARRWRLPGWLAAGRLALPIEVARTFGAHETLFHATRVALALAARSGPDFGLVDGEAAAASAAALGIDPEAFAQDRPPIPGCPREDPKSQPLLRDLLQVAAENRRIHATPRHDRLQDEADSLHLAIEEMLRGREHRLQEEKLTALAEFAAGAGHEINNPLAVILGQAQYLLGHEAEWFAPDPEGEARAALQKIVAQTRRIHSLLRDLMQFARPVPPSPAWHDLAALADEVAIGLVDLAKQRRVTVTSESHFEKLPAFLDDVQTRVAVACLVRNAIEAVPADGQVKVCVREGESGQTLEVVVDDNGPGPDLAIRSSLFDPFFSGRSAGRGRGLGLPIAWRLARQQGGDVHLESARPGGFTRFVLSLPRFEKPCEGEAAPPLTESILAAPLPAADAATNGCHTS